MAVCKACGELIVWIKTVAGKAMPCNPSPTYYWEKEKGSERIVLPNGEVLSCELMGDIKESTGLGYIPHWATCSNSDKFRKKGKSNG